MMKFWEKLNLLMNITSTNNSRLARSISLDASFISRLRRGLREPVLNADYVSGMARYFSHKCSSDYQKVALGEAIGSSSNLRLQDFDSLSEVIHSWLLEEHGKESEIIEDFLVGVSGFRFTKAPPVTPADINHAFAGFKSGVEILYGVEGKQNAVIAFLSLILKSPRPCTLLLYSDEDMGWLTEDPGFTAKWALLLQQVIRGGNRIKIIHTVNRRFDEMLAAIKGWVPIYMTGHIEPYYYPKIRDGIFRRTLFIAPDIAATTSSSIGSETANNANFFFTDKTTIDALIKEYHDFLALCRPLMHIFTPHHKEEYLSILAEFEQEQADSIIKTDMPTNLTMPADVAQTILSRIDTPDRDFLLSYQLKRSEAFISALQQQRHTEIFPLPDLENILSGRAMVSFSDLLGNTHTFYTPEEFYKHLRNIVGLLKEYHNYIVILTEDRISEGCLLYVKEDVGVLVGKTSLPSVVFAINESHMNAAFWDYLRVMQNQESSRPEHKALTIARLEALAARLEEKLIDISG